MKTRSQYKKENEISIIKIDDNEYIFKNDELISIEDDIAIKVLLELKINIK